MRLPKLTKEGRRAKKIIKILTECRKKIGAMSSNDIDVIGVDSWNKLNRAYRSVRAVEDHLITNHQVK